MFGQSAAPSPFITNYQFVSQIRVTPTQTDLTYRADIVNPGAAIANLAAMVRSLDSSQVQVVQGQDTLYFASVPAYGQVTSSNTFTVLVNASAPLDFSDLQWIVGGPVANAGPNQSVSAGSTVMLNGGGSTNPTGAGTLTYNWSFASLPAGSSAVLMNPHEHDAAVRGGCSGYLRRHVDSRQWQLQLQRHRDHQHRQHAPDREGRPESDHSTGRNRGAEWKRSSDLDGNPLSYSWMLIALPSGSTATLTASNTVSPSFVADQPGTYVAQLIVSDGALSSNPVSVTVTTHDPPPVANAGAGQLVSAGALVQLNGSASTDVDGDLLQYQWSLINTPAGSTATLEQSNRGESYVYCRPSRDLRGSIDRQ